MSKEELLKTEFDSACDAMYALEDFLKSFDPSKEECTRGELQGLKVIGNRIYE